MLIEFLTNKKIMQNMSTSGNVSYRNLQEKTVSSILPINQIQEIINNITLKRSRLQASGYDSKNDEYWGKKISKCKCNFIFKIKIKEDNNNSSKIILELVLGSLQDFYDVIKSITNNVLLYESAQFNKNYSEQRNSIKNN